MEKSERGELHFRIVYRIGGNLFVRAEPIETLPLGESYVVKISVLNKKRDDLLNRLLNYLSKFDDDQIANHFSLDGSSISDKAKTWAMGCRREIEDDFARLPIWYGTALFRTKLLADFDYWARSEFLPVDEVVWLSVGLEPKERLIALIKPYNEHGSKQDLDSVAEYMSRHKEMIRRKFDPHDYRKKPDLAALYSWIKAVNLDVHPDFLTMLKARVGLDDAATKVLVPNESAKQMDGREIQSMSKLIAAMAIDGYGYDPRARRSDIPNFNYLRNAKGKDDSTIDKVEAQGIQFLDTGETALGAGVALKRK